MARTIAVVISGIIIVAVIVIALSDEPRFFRANCVGGEAFDCVIPSVYHNPGSGVVAFTLVSGLDEEVVITKIASSQDCRVAEPGFEVRNRGVLLPGFVRPNDEFTLVLDCAPALTRVFRETFTITYDVVDGPSDRQATVSVTVPRVRPV